jgi:glycosyltransferase involved in cell wall biosynthesis/GT2 family glycosyltransferase
MWRPGYFRHQLRKFIQVGRQSGWDTAIARAMAVVQSQLKRPAGVRLGKPGCSYPEWILQNEQPASVTVSQSQPDSAPRFSILLPLGELQCERLCDTVDSIVALQYPNWELVLAVAGSCSSETAACLKPGLGEAGRLHLEVIKPWHGTAAALNAAVRLSTGAYTLAISQGDRLAPNALFEIAALLNEHPELDIVYFDEDRYLQQGSKRSAPWFKPSAFSPALLLSVNYLSHAAIRRELITALGGYNRKMEGAHEWDLILRGVEQTQRIAHIPKVLFHARCVDREGTGSAKPDVAVREAEKRCIAAHLSRRDPEGRSYEVSVRPSGAYHLRLPVAGSQVSIIIPTKDRLDLLRACITSLLERTSYPNFEILLIDTGSTQSGVLEYYRQLESDPRIHLVSCPGRFNYSAANNLGASKAQGSFLLFLNNDTRITHGDWLEEMVGWAEQPGVGAVGAKLLRPDGTYQHAGMVMGLAGHSSHVFDGCREPIEGPFGSADWYRNYLAVTGACMLVPRGVFEHLGGFDTEYQVGYSDIEFCLRIVAAGYQVVYSPFAELVHDEGGTRGLSLPPADVLRASMQFLPVLHTGDPYFNPNLSQLSREPVPACKGDESRLGHIERILKLYGLVSSAGGGDGIFERLLDRLPASEWPLFPLDYLAPYGRGQGKRLLLVSHDLSLSGAPTILFQLAVYLQERGYSITVLSPMDGPLRERYLDAGMDARVEAGLLDDARLLVEPVAAHDLLLANTILSWRAIHAARAMGRPSLWWIHEAEAGRDQARFDEHIASAFPAAGKVVFPAQHTAALYAPYALSDNFETVYIGVKFDTGLEAGDQRIRRRAGKFSLVSVGSIEPRKGQDILLDALAILPDGIRKEIACTFIGRTLDPAYADKLARTIRKRRLQDVYFEGELSSPQVRAHLETCEVFVLPSRSEALPRALLEAMALGKAVIAASVGSIPEVLEGGSGLSFPAGDAKALAHQIASLYGDRSAIDRLGEQARLAIEARFTFEAFAGRMSALVQEALSPVKL